MESDDTSWERGKAEEVSGASGPSGERKGLLFNRDHLGGTIACTPSTSVGDS
jgi:hypothetical protein